MNVASLRTEEIFQQSKKQFIKRWGKILRIAYIVADKNNFSQAVKEAVVLTKSGNFVWVNIIVYGLLGIGFAYFLFKK